MIRSCAATCLFRRSRLVLGWATLLVGVVAGTAVAGTMAGTRMAGTTSRAHAPAIRALFVGIDQYQYSAPAFASAGFLDLRGAVGDVGRIKAALHTAYGLDVDAPAPGHCPTPATNKSASITLTNQCATRVAILAALNDRIKASASGDTLIFYFAGHGGRFDDDQSDKNGHYDTILPYDARNPAADKVTDIIDRQLYGIINRASGRGINVVTIFDSCDSDTGTRDFGGASRGAPPLPTKRADLSGDTPGATASGGSSAGFASGPGYRVHFGAAEDGEEAQEVGGDSRAGVFTSALVAALQAVPQSTFADIESAVQVTLAQSGHAQHSRAEGTGLQAALGGTAAHVALLGAVPSGLGVGLAGGTLLNVTVGSRYALYGSQTDALRAGTTPLAAGKVTEVSAGSATLVMDATPAAPLPVRLVARETAHAFANKALIVRNAALSASGRAVVAHAFDGVSYAVIGAAAGGDVAQLVVGSKTPNDADLALYGDDGQRIAALGPAAGDAFVGCLKDAVQKVARVQALLSLRTVPQAKDLQFCTFDFAGSADDAVNRCRNAPSGPATLPVRAPHPWMIVMNNADQSRFVYVLGIDDTYTVTQLLPRNEGQDDALDPGQPRLRNDMAPDTPGRYQFVTIATDARIEANALEQEGAGTCSAGARDIAPSIPRVGTWTVMVTEAKAQ